jgi:hypothetical protein
MNEQHPNVDFDVEQEYELVWRSESQLNEKVVINTHEQVPSSPFLLRPAVISFSSFRL